MLNRATCWLVSNIYLGGHNEYVVGQYSDQARFSLFGRALGIQLNRLWISGKCYCTVGVFSEATAWLGILQVFMLLVACGRQPCLFQYTRSHKNAVKKNCFVLLLLHLVNQNYHDRLFCYCWHVGYCFPIVLLYFSSHMEYFRKCSAQRFALK